MFTDIEGYTSLMQDDEEKAIQTRDKHRNIFNLITEKHKGRILQYYGDGTLSIFDSAIDAVKCGIEMQLGFQEDPAIPVRIGIHTGDITFSEEEIIGDGVNVASRIESLAVSGSVFISDKVYDEIKNHKSIETSLLRTFKLKNVEKPVEVYAISNVGLVVPKPEDVAGKADKIHDSQKLKEIHRSKVRKGLKLGFVTIFFITAVVFVYMKFGDQLSASRNLDNSIAVLAFENMSADPEQEYFSDGISEEILNSLAQVEGLMVAGRTSSFSYKGKDTDIKDIGNQLKVGMVLEGSVRKSENKLRITAQLISVKDGYHIWSETYDREMEDIFAIQDEIAAKIVEKLRLQFQVPSETKTRTQNLEAYDLVLKGVYFLNKDFEGTRKAMEYFQKAVELDPTYSTAYARIGDAYTNYAAYGFLSNAEAYSKARTAAQKAINLNEEEALAHNVMAYVHLYYDWDWEAALSEYNKASHYWNNNPNHFITFYDIFLNQDYEHAISVAKEILKNDPLEIQHHWHLGFCYYFAERYEEALTSFGDALELDPNYSEGHRWKGSTLIALERYDEAITSLEKALEITKGEGPANIELLTAKILLGQEEEVRQVMDLWISSGENVESMGPALLYTVLGEKDEAVEWLDKAYRERSLFIISLKTLSLWDSLRDDPRFMEIYDRMNFPK
jgi:TolB-like protein